MDGDNFVESVSGWETSEACQTGKARINKGEEGETERENEWETTCRSIEKKQKYVGN